MEKKPLNSNLHKANVAKKDEFYTQLNDINEELKHYREYFRGKTVYCNCDDPYESNFFRYFALSFNALGLKRLITTSYKPSPIANTQLGFFGDDPTLPPSSDRPKITANKFIIDEADIKDERIDPEMIIERLRANKHNEWTPLEWNGDFRSPECIALLQEADIVVSNPPFSLFRDYTAQLYEYDKKFIIIGNQNAITYKEIFRRIKDNQMWLWYGFRGGAAHFINKHYVDYATAGDHKEGMIRVSGVTWFTNVEIKKRHEDMILYRTYSENEHEYPKYDNYDAINIDKTCNIPVDYAGAMGVPITFLDKYNPEQFEIIQFRKGDDDKDLCINGKCPYFRIIIKRKKF